MRARRGRGVAVLVLIGLVVSLALAGVVSYYASSHPDGLEYVAAENGFADKAQTSATAGSPLADYAVSGVSDERISVGVAGILGVAVTALLGFGLFRLVTAGRRSATDLERAGEPAHGG